MSTAVSMLSALSACRFTLLLLAPGLCCTAAAGSCAGTLLACASSWCGRSRLSRSCSRSGHSCGSSAGARVGSRLNTAF